MVDGDFVPRDPAHLMSDVAYLDGVGVTERDVMIGVNNEEGALLLGLEDGLAIDSYTPEEKGRFERFLQVGEGKRGRRCFESVCACVCLCVCVSVCVRKRR